MEVEVLEENENLLLERMELKVRVIYDAATPSRAEIKEKIAAVKNANKDTVVLGSFNTKYGAREAVGLVNIYKTKEKALAMEPRHRLEKSGLVERIKKAVVKKEAPKKQEKAKEAPKKEEKPKEAPKKEEKPKAPEAKPAEAKEKPKEGK